jgi:hypothetical protein
MPRSTWWQASPAPRDQPGAFRSRRSAWATMSVTTRASLRHPICFDATYSITSKPRFLSPSSVSIAENKRSRWTNQGLQASFTSRTNTKSLGLQIPSDRGVVAAAGAKNFSRVKLNDVAAVGIVGVLHVVADPMTAWTFTPKMHLPTA